MTPDQALQLLDHAASILKLSRSEHKQLEKASDILKQELLMKSALLTASIDKAIKPET